MFGAGTMPIPTATGYAVMVDNGVRWLRMELHSPAGVSYGWFDEDGAAAELDKMQTAVHALKSGLIVAGKVMLTPQEQADVTDILDATGVTRDD